MPVVRWLRGYRMATVVSRETDASAGWSLQERRAWQLAVFNEQWPGIAMRVPYWAALKRERALPDHFSSWDEVSAKLPILERNQLQTRVHELGDPQRPPDGWQATGGTTGQPLRIPTSRNEAGVSSRNMWQARAWFGITPADKAFLIWGHSHLLGAGLRGWLRGEARTCKDWLLGYRRWSAYRMGDEDLREAARQLLTFRPSWLLGYSAALDRFATVNADRRSDFAALGLKAAIATGESFPSQESHDRIADTFGCPVAMEYGAQEVGPVAHETPQGRYQVFWRTHHVEAVPSATVPGSLELLLTSLHPRCLPLIRYRIGDLVLTEQPPIGSLFEFQAVIGRCSDTIRLPDGRQVHSKALSHVLRDFAIGGYQLVQRSENELTLRYTAGAPLNDDKLASVRSRLERVEPRLGAIRIEHAAALDQTPAGKIRIVCR